MPTFDLQTPVARHPSHTLCGGWKPGAGTAPILYCRDCFLVVPDPLILEECVKKPHASVIERWLRSQYERLPEAPMEGETAIVLNRLIESVEQTCGKLRAALAESMKP